MTITWSFLRDLLSSAVLFGPFFRFVVRLVVVPPPQVAAPVEESSSGSSSMTVRMVGIGACMVESWSWLGSGMALGLRVSSGISVSEIGLAMVRNEREELFVRVGVR